MVEELLILDESGEVKLNKVWIHMIPEFAVLLKRDKGSPGDRRGEKKARATQEFKFISFYKSFSSPIRDWDDIPKNGKISEKKREALHYAGMDEKQVDDEVQAAADKYEEILLKASRPLRSLKAVYRGLDALDAYYESLDFTKIDKQGKLLNDPSGFTVNIKRLDEAYTAVKNLEKRVEEDLKAGDTGIRGKANLGANEDKVREWSESDIARGSAHVADGKVMEGGTFRDMFKQVNSMINSNRSLSATAIFNDEEEDDNFINLGE